jgi:FkbM family methyltransferase
VIRQFLYNYRIKKFYSKLINKNELCFDIGANIGKKSEILLKIGANVMAFEPQKKCIPKLLLLKSKYKKFNFESLALDNKEGQKHLFLSNYSEIATLSQSFVDIYKYKNVHWTGKETVKTITINEAIKQFGNPYYCKIDVEGYEYEILSILKYKIPLIEFEVVAGFQEKAIDLIKLLNEKNTSFNYTLNEHPEFKCTPWVKIDEITKIIRFFPKRLIHANVFIKNI